MNPTILIFALISWRWIYQFLIISICLYIIGAVSSKVRSSVWIVLKQFLKIFRAVLQFTFMQLLQCSFEFILFHLSEWTYAITATNLQVISRILQLTFPISSPILTLIKFNTINSVNKILYLEILALWWKVLLRKWTFSYLQYVST